MTTGHAKLSPSSSHRWLACPGSVVLEETAPPDKGNAYAAEGTVAHEVAARTLESGADSAAGHLGERHNVDGFEVLVTQSMVDYVNQYVAFVRAETGEHVAMYENAVPLSHMTGEDGATGTADVIIVKPDEIVVIDLKYGMGEHVEVKGNPQLLMYASGALALIEEIIGFIGQTKVRKVVYQPRIDNIDEDTITVADVRTFEERVRAGVDRIRSAQENFSEDWLVVGEKQCRWCRVKAACPALRDEVKSLAGGSLATADDFAAFKVENPDERTGDNFLSMAMSKVGLVEDWCKAVRAEAERRLLRGENIDGFKLVEGKRGPRKWARPEEVEEELKKARIRRSDAYSESLLSPTQMEKTVGAEKPKVWARLQRHITQTDGKPSVAPATDKRPALDVSNHAEDFRKLAK